MPTVRELQAIERRNREGRVATTKALTAVIDNMRATLTGSLKRPGSQWLLAGQGGKKRELNADEWRLVIAEIGNALLDMGVVLRVAREAAAALEGIEPITTVKVKEELL